MNPFLNQNNNLINNNNNQYFNQLNSINDQLNPFLNQQNSLMMNNNPMMMNVNPMMMNNNPVMMNTNPMMMNINPMMMNVNPLMMNANPLMMNINPMMMNNNPSNNIINNKNLAQTNEDFKFNYENLDNFQKNLVNQVINFYHENGCYKMSLGNKTQIKQLIKQLFFYNTNNEDEIESFMKEFNYIKKEKKLIKFLNSNFKIFSIYIPTFITKFDLYTIANKFKAFYSTNFLLIHNNKILKNDESSIDEISNNDYVIIIENRLYPDKSSYISLQKKYPFEDIITLGIFFENGITRNYSLNTEASIQEFISMVIEDNGLVRSDYKFIFNAKYLQNNSQMKIKESGLYDFSKILCSKCHTEVPFRLYGKILKGEAKFKNGKITVEIGTLNDIGFFNKQIQSMTFKRVKSIKIGELKLNRDSDNCLLLYGINEDFYFAFEIENQ